ncbi:MAG TPA: trypsin-like peptidase domain-containing protein, partial [Pseudonocardiaceae bacterium]|nr:trypsin-like peptidase domain-containing protein [Pseudonocardiaceae bacterium]
MSEVDRPGYPETGSGSASAGPPTVQYPLSNVCTDRNGGWDPPPERHLSRLLTILLVAFVSVVAAGVVRVMWPAAAAQPPSASSASSSWASPIAALPVSSDASSGALDLSTVAASVNPAVVDINTQLGDGNGRGAGTGIVLTPSGEVLTNNHVINGATTITATDVGNGQTYPATVVGYDRSHDIAVLQLQGASGLQTASIGDSSTVAVGDQIAAIGNAGGRGGTPSAAAGTVSALDQMITVSDEFTGDSEQLAGLIQVAADVQPGDSGGPLVNA